MPQVSDGTKRFEIRYRITRTGKVTEPRTCALDDLDDMLRDVAEVLAVGEERELGGAYAATTLIRRIA